MSKRSSRAATSFPFFVKHAAAKGLRMFLSGLHKVFCRCEKHVFNIWNKSMFSYTKKAYREKELRVSAMKKNKKFPFTGVPNTVFNNLCFNGQPEFSVRNSKGYFSSLLKTQSFLFRQTCTCFLRRTILFPKIIDFPCNNYTQDFVTFILHFLLFSFIWEKDASNVSIRL